MDQLAAWIDAAIANHTEETKLAAIKAQVKELTDRFPLYPELSYQ
jgi:glycine/serine hydroxymethyltransferase